MSSSQESDSDDEEYCKERRAMKLLEMVAKEIERYCEVAKGSTAKMDDTARNTYKEVFDAGSVVKKFIDNVKKNVQLRIETAYWEEVTSNFIFHTHTLCIYLDVFKEEHRSLHELQITIDTFSDLMKDIQGEKTKQKGIKRRKALKGRQITPKKTKTVKFIKVSPKAYDILDKFDCPICDKNFVFLKSLKRHVKENHEGVQIPDTFKEKKDLVTCRMCKNKKFSRDQMQRHLKYVHNVTKVDHENKKTNLRGWFTMDDVQWLPLWLSPNDEDPEEEMVVPVKGNVIEIFGNHYEVDNVNVEKKNEDSSEEMRGNKLEIDSQYVSSNKKKIFFPDHDTSLVKEIRKEEPTEYLQDAFVEDDIFEEKSIEIDTAMSYKRNLFGRPSEQDFRPQMTGFVEDVVTENWRVEEEGLEENTDIGLSLPETSCRNLMKTNASENLKLKVFVETEKDEDFWIMGIKDEDLDSDYEEGDSESFTKARIEMKSLRYKRRNEDTSQEKLVDRKENAEFISDFEDWLVAKDVETNRDKSTIRKVSGYLFTYNDSLLAFNTNKYEDYHLLKHVTIDDDEFSQVSDPTIPKQWIQSVAGDDGKQYPSKRKDMLKAHARFRDYLYEKLSTLDFGSSVEDLMRKELVLKNLNEITNQIKKKKVFQQLTRMEENERNKTKLARKVVYPEEEFNENKAVGTWLSSKEAKKEEEKHLKIYENFENGGKPSSKDFNSYALYGRFNLAIIDKNRRGAYNFTNEEFAGRVPIWLPGGKANDEDTADEYDMIPDDWNPTKPSEDGMEPSCYAITVSGDNKGMKLGENANIVLTKKVLQILLRYRDLKQAVFGTLAITDPFFVNFKGEKLGPLQRNPGSFLDKMSKVTGAEKLTVNSFRRAAEKVVQGSPKLKEHIKAVQSHSKEVGMKNYYRGGKVVRAQFISNLSDKESPASCSTDEVSKAVKETRENIEKEERAEIMKKAKEKLTEDKMKKNLNYKLEPKDRSFLQELFSADEHIVDASKFPDQKSWKKIFYRAVDSEVNENGAKIRDIEEGVFRKTKKEVENSTGPWKGSMSQNKLSDVKISAIVRNSFKAYDKSVPFDMKVFKF